MKRRRRTKILIQANKELPNRLAKEITDAHDVQDIIQARAGLTMIKMRESAKQSQFYIGEVLVTEAKVEIAGVIGVGIVQGINQQLARELAIIDAAFISSLPEIKSWETELLAAEKKINNTRLNEQVALEETMVNFKTMDV